VSPSGVCGYFRFHAEIAKMETGDSEELGDKMKDKMGNAHEN
jgi:hypothetical protein